MHHYTVSRPSNNKQTYKNEIKKKYLQCQIQLGSTVVVLLSYLLIFKNVHKNIKFTLFNTHLNRRTTKTTSMSTTQFTGVGGNT